MPDAGISFPAGVPPADRGQNRSQSVAIARRDGCKNRFHGPLRKQKSSARPFRKTMERRRLPPLNALRAFEAAARHLNFSRAADELAVTPGAVSQQIQNLEDYVG